MADRNRTNTGENEDIREDEKVRGVAEEGEGEFEETEDLDEEEEEDGSF
jgi:hypothetical protein